MDELIPEPNGPAHRNKQQALASVKTVLREYVMNDSDFDPKTIFEKRVDRWKKIGHWEEVDPSELNSFHRPVTRLPVPESNGYVKRHVKCYDTNGIHHYDPESLKKLEKTNYVCGVCGHRYVRPSAWDYINWIVDDDSFAEHDETKFIADKDILGFPGYVEKLKETRRKTGLVSAMITGNGIILGKDVVLCATDFGFLGGSFCMSTGEKVWRAAQIAIDRMVPLILQASGGGARMHEGCSSMVSIPKAHVAISCVENAGLPVVTLITDPTLGGVAIGMASRGKRLFEFNAGHIGFSGKRVIEQYTGKKTSKGFQTVDWLKKHGHAERIIHPEDLRDVIYSLIKSAN